MLSKLQGTNFQKKKKKLKQSLRSFKAEWCSTHSSPRYLLRNLMTQYYSLTKVSWSLRSQSESLVCQVHLLKRKCCWWFLKMAVYLQAQCSFISVTRIKRKRIFPFVSVHTPISHTQLNTHPKQHCCPELVWLSLEFPTFITSFKFCLDRLFFTSQSSEEEMKGKNEKVQQDALSHSVPCQIAIVMVEVLCITGLPLLWMVCHRGQDPRNVAVYRGCSIVIPDVILHIFVSSTRGVQFNIYVLFFKRRGVPES